MFDAMGSAELYRMDSGDAEDNWSARLPSKRPPSQGMSKSASMSAMAMDLGLKEPESRVSTPLGRCSSVGALRAIKANKANKHQVLPQLYSAPEWSVAPMSMNMSK